MSQYIKLNSKKGFCHLSMSDIQIPTQVNNFVEVRLIPRPTRYIVEIVYEKQEEEQLKSEYLAINADVNGSLQILRKVFPDAYTAEEIASAAVAPIMVLPL